MNLLLRFYDPQGGRITLDGVSTKDLNIKFLRSVLGYVLYVEVTLELHE